MELEGVGNLFEAVEGAKNTVVKEEEKDPDAFIFLNFEVLRKIQPVTEWDKFMKKCNKDNNNKD